MKLLLTWITLVFCINTLAQSDETVVLKVDFKNKKITSVPKGKVFRQAIFFQLQIDSLPPGQYKIAFNKTDSFITAGTPPALFGVLSFGDGFSSLLSGLTAYSNRSIANSTAVKAAKNLNGTTESLQWKKRTESEDETWLFFNECSRKDTVLVNTLMRNTRQFIFNHYFAFRDSVIKPADRLYSLLDLKQNLAADSAAIRLTALQIIEKRLQLEYQLEAQFNNYYNQILTANIYPQFANCSYLKVADSMFVNYKKGFNAFLAKFDSSFNEAAMVKVYKRITASQAPVRYISLPQSIKGDVLNLSIDITGIDQAKTPQSFNTSLSLSKYPYRLIGFTSGIYLSGLHNREFSIATNVQTNVTNPNKLDTLHYSIREENNNRVEAGIMALMHYGGYFTRNTGAFVAFGPGLSLEKNPKPRIALGAGFMFGRTNRLAISAGLLAGSVKRLTSSYNLSAKYNPKPTDITTDKFATSWYFSLGYQLWGK